MQNVDIKEIRQTAKKFGGKALKGGSAKQKAWAEAIRKKVLESLGETESRKFFDLSGCVEKTTWWIDNRFTSVEKFKRDHLIDQFKLSEASNNFFDYSSSQCYSDPEWAEERKEALKKACMEKSALDFRFEQPLVWK